jgi:hypothetical protein
VEEPCAVAHSTVQTRGDISQSALPVIHVFNRRKSVFLPHINPATSFVVRWTRSRRAEVRFEVAFGQLQPRLKDPRDLGALALMAGLSKGAQPPGRVLGKLDEAQTSSSFLAHRRLAVIIF